MYILIHNVNEERSESLSIRLHKEFPGKVKDVRSDDYARPDDDLAGNYWYGAHVTIKLCDMFADNQFNKDDIFILSSSTDLNLSVLEDLNIQYHLGATIYLFEDNQFIDINSMIPYNITELEQTIEEDINSW
jgi:hypothetical protein